MTFEEIIRGRVEKLYSLFFHDHKKEPFGRVKRRVGFLELQSCKKSTYASIQNLKLLASRGCRPRARCTEIQLPTTVQSRSATRSRSIFCPFSCQTRNGCGFRARFQHLF